MKSNARRGDYGTETESESESECESGSESESESESEATQSGGEANHNADRIGNGQLYH